MNTVKAVDLINVLMLSRGEVNPRKNLDLVAKVIDIYNNCRKVNRLGICLILILVVTRTDVVLKSLSMSTFQT